MVAREIFEKCLVARLRGAVWFDTTPLKRHGQNGHWHDMINTQNMVFMLYNNSFSFQTLELPPILLSTMSASILCGGGYCC